MRPHMNTKLIVAGLALAAGATAANAAAPTILRFVIAGGGQRSATGAYVVTGTIGQALAGPTAGPMVGGSYSVRSGFWPGDGPIQCIADYNGDTLVDILDFLDFIGAFGDGDLFADYDGNCEVDILDFLDFFADFGSY